MTPQTVNQKLDEILGLAQVQGTDNDIQELVPSKPAEIASSENPDEDMQRDYEIVRGGMRNLIEKTSELVDCANFFAKEKQDARSVEAASMATKEARENLMALINLHKTRKEIERVSATSPAAGGGDTNITQNAVFLGNTAELLKFTKANNSSLTEMLKTITVAPDTKALNTSEE